MEVRPDIQIQAAITALKDVIIPALPVDNKVALEHGHLIVGTLQHIAKWLPLAFRYDVGELERYVALSHALIDLDLAAKCGDEVGDLEACLSEAESTLGRARVEPSEIDRGVIALRASVGMLIDAVSEKLGREESAAVRQLVLIMSKCENELERALLIDLGFETDPSRAPPDIEQLLSNMQPGAKP